MFKTRNDVYKEIIGNDKHIDALCSKRYKIDVKSSCLAENYRWMFHIYYNETADYFLLIGFDNRKKLNVLRIWLIKGDELINSTHSTNRKLCSFYTFSIINDIRNINKYKKYELEQDKIDIANKLCIKFKDTAFKMNNNEMVGSLQIQY